MLVPKTAALLRRRRRHVHFRRQDLIYKVLPKPAERQFAMSLHALQLPDFGPEQLIH